MQDHVKTSQNAHISEPQGSIMRGVLGGIVGMAVCMLVLTLGGLYQIIEPAFMLQLFVALVIGWFYRLFHGRRSKFAAYGIVCIYTVLTCVLWVIVFALLSAGVSPAQLTAKDWIGLWDVAWELFLLCVGLGLVGFFFTRKRLLPYVDEKKAPWHTAYTYAGGALYNLLPEKLPGKNPPASFAVHDRFSSRTGIIVEGNTLRWKRSIRKDRVFSVHDIVGVVLGPSNGSNVIYDENYQTLAKFAASMEHADLLFLWLLQRNIPIDKVPDGWRLPEAEKAASAKAENPTFQRRFTLRLNRSTRIVFAGIGVFLLVLGILVLLGVVFFPPQTTAERWATVVLELAVFAMGIACLRIGRVCQVKIDGEHIRAVSRFGRAKEFSVRDVSSVSGSTGWIVLYDREWKPLVKLDPGLENIDVLKEYLALYGVSL